MDNKDLAIELLGILYGPVQKDKTVSQTNTTQPKDIQARNQLPDSLNWEHPSSEQTVWTGKIKQEVYYAKFASFQEFTMETKGGQISKSEDGKFAIEMTSNGMYPYDPSPVLKLFKGSFDYMESREQRGDWRYYVGLFKNSEHKPLVLGAGVAHQDFVGRPNRSAFALAFNTIEGAREFLKLVEENPQKTMELYLRTILGPTPQTEHFSRTITAPYKNPEKITVLTADTLTEEK